MDQKIKILLVDDHEENLFSLETVLEKENYKLTSVTSGLKALKVLLAEQDFALILMDVHMPGMDGFETASLIYKREKLENIPIIFITANYTSHEFAEKGFETGGVDYILKPFNPGILKAKIKVYLKFLLSNQLLLTKEQKLMESNTLLQKQINLKIDEVFQKNLELEEKNKQLGRINNDLDNFIYTASHDLKSPIANMEGILTGLNKTLPNKLTERENKMLEMLGSSANRLTKTINDLGEIIKIERESEEATEVLCFRELVDEVKSDLNRLITVSEAGFSESYQVAEILFVRKNLKSIIYNLLLNSLKFRSPDRKLEITINTSRQQNNIVLCVKDNGTGIAKNYLSKLFTMFKKLHPDIEGTGIGLYTIKRIIENNGGKIEVESDTNKGAMFKVFFKQK